MALFSRSERLGLCNVSHNTRLHGFLHVVGHSMITGWSVELRGKNGPAFIDYWPILAVSD